MKKILIFVGLFSIPAIADELHVFTNGEVADADKINENFEILQASGGGCSAEQQDSTVVITCADGTSAVLASEGTVVVYPESVLGEPIDYETLPTGEIVIMDANDVVLGVAETSSYFYRLEILLDEGDRKGDVAMWNDSDLEAVGIGAASGFQIFYTDTECTSAPYTSLVYGNNFGVIDIDGDLFATNATQYQSVLFNSRRKSGFKAGTYRPTSECITAEAVATRFNTLSPLVLPDEITNAAYPVRLEQLP